MYDYLKERPKLFTEEGVVKCIRVRDNIKYLCELAGACTVEQAISGVSGDTWTLLAIIDWLEERKEIRLIHTQGAAQHRVILPG